MSRRQHLLNDAINKGALRGCDPDPVLVRTVEEATERPTSGVGFGSGRSRAGFGSGSHAAFTGLGKDGDKNRLIYRGGVGDQGKPVDAMLQGQGKLRSSEQFSATLHCLGRLAARL